MTTERWTDEMVDGLASSVRELREESRASARELRESIRELREESRASARELRESIGELREESRASVGELREELRESIGELRDGVDGMRITTQALLQLAAQQQQASQRHEAEMELMKQRQAENDERFNTLLAEVRYLIRRLDRPEQS